MNGKTNQVAAVTLMEKFMENRIWAKLYGPLANDWLSIREASMEIESKKTKEYTLNRSVQLCIRNLLKDGYLESKKVTKIKESTTKKGTPRKYTSTCLRYNLKVGELWTDFFAQKCHLNDKEKCFLYEILREPSVERILRNENLRPRWAFTCLISQFAFIANSTPELEDFLRRVGDISTKNLTVLKFLDLKSVDEFIKSLKEKMLKNKSLAIQLSKKIIDTDLDIFFTSRDYATIIFDRIPKDMANVFSQILLRIVNDQSIGRYRYFLKKRIVDIILDVYKGEIGSTFAQNVKDDIKS